VLPVRVLAFLTSVLAVAILGSCRSGPSRPPVVSETPQEPGEPSPQAPSDEAALRVQAAPEPVVVAAWSEPRALSAGGGEAQILVRTQKRGGAPFPGIEVRLRTSVGSLFSAGRVLVTDSRGMTRDRLTARRTAEITLNAGGTRYTFLVPVLPASAQ
jgi:hypothetical protein